MKHSHSRAGLRTALVAAVAALALPASAHALDLNLKGSLGEGGLQHYVSPVSNPIFNETPYITTEVRPLWLHQQVPNNFASDGGDIDVVAVQLRAALTDRLGFIATKDGWADIDFNKNVPDTNGMANLAFGFKYAILALPESNSVVTVGVKYEAPVGHVKTAGINMQGQGDGLMDFVTGKRFWAHGPGGDDTPNVEPVMLWIEIQKQKGSAPRFIPHIIGESLGSGMGTQFTVSDFNGDKLPDLIMSNKRGTNVLLQQRSGK